MIKTLDDRLNEGQFLSRAIYNLNNSEYINHKRMLKRVKQVLDYDYSYFLTYTISPQYEHIDIKTIKRKIKEALGGASQWIANEDYGNKNGRLHFHALVGYDFQLDYTKLHDIYKYGNVKSRDIHTKNAEALRNYMIKLTLHAEKDTANTIFYSRAKRGEKK